MYKEFLTAVDNKPKKSKKAITFKVIKLLIYSFLILSMLWGCSEMFIPKFNSYQVVDSSGAQVYKPGVFFEILINGIGGKIHYFHYKGGLYEYPYLSISSWAQAFQQTKSPFYGFFVYPVAWLLVEMAELFKKGIGPGAAILISILIMSILVRLITIGFTWKAQMNQDKMQILQVKQNEIKQKYKNSKDPTAKRKQQMEIMELYKKNNMNPLASIGTTFLSFPFLFALYITIKSTRYLKVAHVGVIELIQKPWAMMTSGHIIYVSLLAIYLPIQIISVFLPTILNLKQLKSKTPEQKKAQRKQYLMQTMFVGVFFFVAISVASGVVFYWIFSGVLQVLQTLLFHYAKIWNKNREKNKLIKQRKLMEIEKKHFMEINAKIIEKNNIDKKRSKKVSKKVLAKKSKKTFKL